MQYITIKKPISSIDDYTPNQDGDAEVTNVVAGYGLVDGAVLNHDTSQLKLVTIIITPVRSITCLMDVEAMNLTEDSKVEVVMVGNETACILNKEEKKYAYFTKALHNKYNRPRVVTGINIAIVSVIAGYLLYVIMQKAQSEVGSLITAGASVALFLGSLMYTSHVSVDTKYGHNKLRQYLKKLLK